MKHKLLKTLTFLWLLALWHPMHAQQWDNIWPYNPSLEFSDPFFHSADTGWVIAYRSLYYTTNGGETFQHVYQLPDSLVYGMYTCMLSKVYPVSGTVAYLKIMRMMGDRIYKTTDGGLTFKEWEFPSSVDFHRRIYISGDTVVAYRPTPSSIVYSLDGGLNWNSAEGATSLDRGFHYFTKTNEGVLWAFGRANNDYFYSTDSGLSWQSKPAVVENSKVIIQVSFLDEEKAVMLVNGKVNTNYVYWLYVTDDGFNTIKFTHDLSDFFNCSETVEICYQKEDAIWMVHTSNIYMSTNGGESFEVYQPLNCQLISNLHFRGNVGYVGGKAYNPYRDIVLRHVDTTTNITPTSITDNTLLVFPNPAKEELTLTLPPSTIGKLRVSIVSIDGKTLLTFERIVDDNNPNFTVPLHSLSIGVYFVRASGHEFSETIKFIINR